MRYQRSSGNLGYLLQSNFDFKKRRLQTKRIVKKQNVYINIKLSRNKNFGCLKTHCCDSIGIINLSSYVPLWENVLN